MLKGGKEDEYIKKSVEVSIQAGAIVGVLYDALLGVDLITIDILDDAIVIPPTNVESNMVLFSGIGLISLIGIFFTLKSLRKERVK